MALGLQGSSVIFLKVGSWSIEIDGDRLGAAYRELGEFLESISEPEPRTAATSCQLQLLAAFDPAGIFIDYDERSIYLRLPLAPMAKTSVACIAILQAAFRGLALLTDDPALVLLHGSAVATHDSRIGIGIVDGGYGAGKTSLSLALAELGYSLVIDEFLACEARNDSLFAYSQPRLPWHIRQDMAPCLSVNHNRAGLQVFPRLASAELITPIKVLVMPDWSLPVGTCVAENGGPPDCCITDHLNKFFDPILDHVSLYAKSPAPLAASRSAGWLNEHVRHRIAEMKSAMGRVSKSQTLLRVGIGPPAAIGLAARAVAERLHEIFP